MPFVVKLIVRKRAVCRPACEFILGLGAALAAVTLLPLEHRVGVCAQGSWHDDSSPVLNEYAITLLHHEQVVPICRGL